MAPLVNVLTTTGTTAARAERPLHGVVGTGNRSQTWAGVGALRKRRSVLFRFQLLLRRPRRAWQVLRGRHGRAPQPDAGRGASVQAMQQQNLLEGAMQQPASTDRPELQMMVHGLATRHGVLATQLCRRRRRKTAAETMRADPSA